MDLFEILTFERITLAIHHRRIVTGFGILATQDIEGTLKTVLNARNKHFPSTLQLSIYICSTWFVAIVLRATDQDLSQKFMGMKSIN